jgi:ParB family transcriptional regulator, chromosome partitioning protein
MATEKRSRLGRGLSELLGGAPRLQGNGPAFGFVAELPVRALRAGSCQPRQPIAEDSLVELADSIRAQGVLQPIIARPIAVKPADGSACTHEIVAGERRWRAAIVAGLATIPAVVRELDDRGALAVALVENLQRQDLNVIEVARALARLTEEFGLTHAEAAQITGRSRAAVSNALRLLELRDEVKALLATGAIDMGHARALLALPPDRQVALATKAAANDWSVRQVERAVSDELNEPSDSAGEARTTDLQTQWLQQQIAHELATRFAIRRGKDGYTLQLGFSDLGHLQDVLLRVQQLLGQVRDTAGPRTRDNDA